MAERRKSGLVVPRGGPDLPFRVFIRVNAGGGPALGALYARDRLRAIERWQEEAAEAAVAGNPQRAGYIEWMAARLVGGRR